MLIAILSNRSGTVCEEMGECSLLFDGLIYLLKAWVDIWYQRIPGYSPLSIRIPNASAVVGLVNEALRIYGVTVWFDLTLDVPMANICSMNYFAMINYSNRQASAT